jgi:hypothetical protein
MSGLTKNRPALIISFGEDLGIVNNGVSECITGKTKDINSRWLERIATIKKRHRAFGSMAELSSCRSELGRQVPEKPMPAI